MGKLRDAFSLRRNVRALFVPADAHLAPLDGLRALSILWVVLFHAGWYARWLLPPRTYGALLVAPWMLPFWRGDFGVDVFFVLSGFLISGLLVDEREATGRVRLGLFYARRLLRLWPALAVALAIDLAWVGDHPESAWANLLYLSNFVPVASVCMGWTWSLSIEEQFYLVCPWLLRPRARAWLVTALLVAGVAASAFVVASAGLRAFDAEIVINRAPSRWALAFDLFYVKPWTRAGALMAGVLAALLWRRRATFEAIFRARAAVWLAAPIALGAVVASTHWPLVAGAPRAVEIAYLASFRTVFALGVAFFLLLSLSSHPLGRALGRVLGSRALHPIAQLAYASYLLNPLVTTWVHLHLRATALATSNPMLLLMPLDALATFAAAAVLHLVVERPFMNLRPRAPRAIAPASATVTARSGRAA